MPPAARAEVDSVPAEIREKWVWTRSWPGPRAGAGPLGGRGGEALLGAMNHLVGQQVGDGLLEDALGAGAHLERARDREGVLDERVVEERYPRLDRGRHGDLVDAHQQQLGQAQ